MGKPLEYWQVREIAEELDEEFDPLIGKRLAALHTDYVLGDGEYWTRAERKKAWTAIDEGLSTKFKTNTFMYKVGRWTVDVWDFGHPKVVFGLHNARRGGLVAMFTCKEEAKQEYKRYQQEVKEKEGLNALRAKAADVLTKNGFSKEDLVKLGV